MNRKSDPASGVEEPSPSITGALTVVVTPYEIIETEQTSPSDWLQAAAEATGATALAASKTVMTAAKVVGRSAEGAAKSTASVVAGAAASATQVSAEAAAKAATVAGATFHLVGDLNGDGRCDAEDLRIAKAAVGKVMSEVGGEAAAFSKDLIRHPVAREAAIGAVVGGAIAAGLPLISVPVGAALGAAALAKLGFVDAAAATAGKIVGNTAGGAVDLAKAALKPTPKSKAKKSRPRTKR